MTNHKLTRQPSATELMERKRKAKEQRKPPATNRYLAQKSTGLKYDYSTIPEAHREQVQRAALEIHRWQRDTIEIGKTLLGVKEVLEHGQFLDWLEVEFDNGLRVLQQSMNVARLLKDNPKAHDYALLSASALYLLAAPSTPKTVRWEIQERIELTDWRPTRGQIQEVIREYRPPKQLPAGNPLGADATSDTIEAEYTIMPAPDRTVAMLADPATTPIQLAAIFAEATAEQLEEALTLLPEEAVNRHDSIYRQMRKLLALAEAQAAMLKPPRWESARESQVDLLARTIAVKGLLHEIELTQPGLRQAIEDLQEPLKRLIGAMERHMK